MKIKKITQAWMPLLAGLALLGAPTQRAQALPQQFTPTVTAQSDVTTFRWDSSEPVSYEKVLREKIYADANFTGAVSGKNLMWQDGVSTKVSHFDVDWNFPLAHGITTGPTAGVRWDASDTLLPGRRSASAGYDPLWHASTTAFGWQVTAQMGPLQPWARIGYYQQYGQNMWKSQPGMSASSGTQQEGGWTEVRIGADLPVSQDVAAFAMLSQAEGMSNGNDLQYLMGFNARF